MKEQPLSALLGRGASWSGDLSFEGRVRIDGVFRGRIYSEDTLEIGSDGAVIGELDVAVLVVAGTADGMIRVRERLTLESTGKLLGKVDARWLEIRPGGKIEATVRVG